ncbi:MAG: hypothetical protein ACOX0L_08745 [Natronincolaceae bacterium]|jgi:hypothetical protein|nr:hypothetical protein [Bacillota bacterium]NLK91467.1 hypothetical protein [Clostridiales bacterium]
MYANKVIKLDEYRRKKIKQKDIRHINRSKDPEEDDRKNTFNLFMRVLSTIREESY